MSDGDVTPKTDPAPEHTIPGPQERADPRERRRKSWGPSVASPEAQAILVREIEEGQRLGERLTGLVERLQSDDSRYIIDEVLPAAQIKIAMEAFENNEPEDIDFSKKMLLAWYAFHANKQLTEKLENAKRELEMQVAYVHELSERLEQVKRRKNG